MANPHSTQLGHAAALGTTDSTIYTTPASTRTILKSIVAYNLAGSASWLLVTISNGGGTVGYVFGTMTAAGTNGACLMLAPWIVLNAGDVVKAHCETGTCGLILSGAQLAA
jgi:hypothetical protein